MWCQGLLTVAAESGAGGLPETGGGQSLCGDLTEATLDVLARYTHSNISSLPIRPV